MIKQLNRILKLVGFNLVRAKRKKTSIPRGLERYTPDYPLLPKCSDGNTKLSDYMGETEWQNAPPPNPGKTHYVGDGCLGEQGVSGCDDHEITRTEHESKR